MTGIPGKSGIVYTLDRETGEFLWATPTVTQNVVGDIDGDTGDVTENPEAVFSALGQEVLACPTLIGGKDWEAGAYSPLTNAMYMPLGNACARMLATMSGNLQAYALGVRHQLAPGTDQLGTVRAISAETGRTLWTYEQREATMSLVATGGGLVFGGDVNWAIPGSRPGNGRRAVGNQPRLAGDRLPHHLRRRRSAVRGRQHGLRGDGFRLHRPDAGDQPERGQYDLRLRPPGSRSWSGVVHSKPSVARSIRSVLPGSPA